MRLRHVIPALALLTSGTVIGVAAQQIASADVSSGDRPVFVPAGPCRVADTRPTPATVGPRSAPLAAGDTHTIDVTQSGTECDGVVPVDASAVALNVTAIGATEQTFLTIWAGGERPDASSLNPAPGQPPTPNSVTVELSVDREFDVYNDRGSVNLVVDITGYYVHHDHDDRYLTAAEVGGAIADATAALPWETFLSPVEFRGYGVPGTAGAEYSPFFSGFSPGGLIFDADMSSRAQAYFAPPANHEGGRDISLDVVWSGQGGANPGCTYRVSISVNRYRAGAMSATLPVEFDGNLINPTGSSNTPEAVTTATIDGGGIRPGDVLQLFVRRAASDVLDTCDDQRLVVLGVTARPA